MVGAGLGEGSESNHLKSCLFRVKMFSPESAGEGVKRLCWFSFYRFQPSPFPKNHTLDLFDCGYQKGQFVH